MASKTQPSMSTEDSNRAKNSALSPQAMLFRTQFSWEHLCYITHFANFCKDTNALLEMFNSQFDTDRTLGSIELFLKKCEMEDFIILSQYADHYNWYNEHPARPGHPLIFLGSQTMRTELRAYLAYHHDRGMDFSTLKEHFNQTFATEARSSGQLKQQVNLLKNDNYLLNCLRNFSPRYPWHPKYKETLEYNETIKRKEALKKRTEAAHYADSKSAAKARLVAAKKTSKKHGSDPAAQAEQNRLLGREAGTEEMPPVAQKEPAGPSKKSNQGKSAAQNEQAGKENIPSENAIQGSIDSTTAARVGRPEHAAGRARSASPRREDAVGEGSVKRGRRRSF